MSLEIIPVGPLSEFRFGCDGKSCSDSLLMPSGLSRLDAIKHAKAKGWTIDDEHGANLTICPACTRQLTNLKD
jgi:hypothetical protein